MMRVAGLGSGPSMSNVSVIVLESGNDVVAVDEWCRRTCVLSRSLAVVGQIPWSKNRRLNKLSLRLLYWHHAARAASGTFRTQVVGMGVCKVVSRR